MDENESYGPDDRQYWEDRWTVLYELSPDDMAHPRMRRLHLEAAIELQKRDVVKPLATSMAESEKTKDRRWAARGLLALARQESITGDMKAAYDHVRVAIKVWPEAREGLSEDPELSMYLPK